MVQLWCVYRNYLLYCEGFYVCLFVVNFVLSRNTLYLTVS